MKFTFKGGIHPLAKIHHGKILSSNCAIEKAETPAVVKIPLSQHIGAPANAIVSAGDYVRIGQKIGEAVGFVSVPCHSSVSGTVKAVEDIPGINGGNIKAVVIENDYKYETADLKPLDYRSMKSEEIISAIREAGIVGMGGAAFPLHVKLSPPPDKKIDKLIINGAECEPFLTADHRLMLEFSNEIIGGIKIIMKALDLDSACIGVEDNKPDAIASLNKAAAGSSINICELKTKYPQGGEKQLINAITGRVVPSGALPSEVGVVVSNVATAKAVYDAFNDGMPLVSRVVTVTGSVNRPANVICAVGVQLSDLIDFAGGIKGDAVKIVSGGPMMGLTVPTLDCVCVKGTSGILVLGNEYFPKKQVETACIQCGRCANACPMHLLPMRISLAAERNNFEAAEKFHAVDCINCGSCTYVCPAKRSVSQLVKLARDQVILRRAKEKQKNETRTEKEKKDER